MPQERMSGTIITTKCEIVEALQGNLLIQWGLLGNSRIGCNVISISWSKWIYINLYIKEENIIIKPVRNVIN